MLQSKQTTRNALIHDPQVQKSGTKSVVVKTPNNKAPAKTKKTEAVTDYADQGNSGRKRAGVSQH